MLPPLVTFPRIAFPLLESPQTLSPCGLLINCGVRELWSLMAQGFNLPSLFPIL